MRLFRVYVINDLGILRGCGGVGIARGVNVKIVKVHRAGRAVKSEYLSSPAAGRHGCLGGGGIGGLTEIVVADDEEIAVNVALNAHGRGIALIILDPDVVPLIVSEESDRILDSGSVSIGGALLEACTVSTVSDAEVIGCAKPESVNETLRGGGINLYLCLENVAGALGGARVVEGDLITAARDGDELERVVARSLLDYGEACTAALIFYRDARRCRADSIVIKGDLTRLHYGRSHGRSYGSIGAGSVGARSIRAGSIRAGCVGAAITRAAVGRSYCSSAVAGV